MEWWIFAPAVSTLCSESEYRVVIFEGFVQMYFFSRFVLSAALLVLFARADVAAKAPLNVVFILADDLGWSDTTLFGTTSLYETPNIERLAGMGMTFRRAYASSPLCSPTRASILTGLSPARHGITAPVCHLPEVHLQAIAATAAAPDRFSTIPQSVTRLDTTHFTLAEALRQQGYATGHFESGIWAQSPIRPSNTASMSTFRTTRDQVRLAVMLLRGSLQTLITIRPYQISTLKIAWRQKQLLFLKRTRNVRFC